MKTSVLAIVTNPKERGFLAIKRRDVPMWVLPGGGVEQQESPDAAAIREVSEETGLKVVIVRKVAEYTPINKLTLITSLYECAVAEGEPITGTETKEIGFFSYDSPPVPFFHIHHEMLQDFLLQEPQTIYKPFSQVTYWALIKYFLKHPCLVIRLLCSRLGFPINSN